MTVNNDLKDVLTRLLGLTDEQWDFMYSKGELLPKPKRRRRPKKPKP
jgi:hypothetical protein